MVQYAIPAEVADRRSAARGGRAVEAGRTVEGRVGDGSWARMVCEDRGPAALASAPAAGFFKLVAGILQRRFHDRPGGKSEILERRESAGASEGTRGCARRAAYGVESRRLRSRCA